MEGGGCGGIVSCVVAGWSFLIPGFIAIGVEHSTLWVQRSDWLRKYRDKKIYNNMLLRGQHCIIFILCTYVRNISKFQDIFVYQNLLIDLNYIQWARTREKQTIPLKLLHWQKPRCSHSMHFLYTNDNQLSHKKDLCCTLHLWSWELCVRRCVCVCV